MTPNQFAWNAALARKTLPHGQRPTDLHVRIAWTLARWQNDSPSHAKLAKAVDCSRGSVGNALHRLRGLGLLSWKGQVRRLRGGWVARIANRYFFTATVVIESHFDCSPNIVHSAEKAADAPDPALRIIRERRMRALGLAV